MQAGGPPKRYPLVPKLTNPGASHMQQPILNCAGAGFRLEVKAQGVDLLLLWYRNQIYAIEGRWMPSVVLYLILR